MHSFIVHSNESACRKSGCLGLDQINYCIIWYLKRNKCILKYIFILCLLFQRVMNISWIPFITLCYIPFPHTFIYLEKFRSISIVNRFIPLVKVMLLHFFIKTHVWSHLIRDFCPTCWMCLVMVNLVNDLNITSVCYL